MLVELKSSCHEAGPSFDYLARGAAVGYARGCPCKYGPSSQARPSCLHLHVPTFVSPPIRHLVKEYSPLRDLILSKRVKRRKSILALSSSRISHRMSPSGDSLIVGSIPSPIHFWIAIKRHLESVSRISGLLLPAYVITSSRAMHAAACSALLEDDLSLSLPTLQKPPISLSCL